MTMDNPKEKVVGKPAVQCKVTMTFADLKDKKYTATRSVTVSLGSPHPPRIGRLATIMHDALDRLYPKLSTLENTSCKYLPLLSGRRPDYLVLTDERKEGTIWLERHLVAVNVDWQPPGPDVESTATMEFAAVKGCDESELPRLYKEMVVEAPTEAIHTVKAAGHDFLVPTLTVPWDWSSHSLAAKADVEREWQAPDTSQTTFLRSEARELTWPEVVYWQAALGAGWTSVAAGRFARFYLHHPASRKYLKAEGPRRLLPAEVLIDSVRKAAEIYRRDISKTAASDDDCEAESSRAAGHE